MQQKVVVLLHKSLQPHAQVVHRPGLASRQQLTIFHTVFLTSRQIRKWSGELVTDGMRSRKGDKTEHEAVFAA